MAQWHLDSLREALSRKGWTVVEELAGNGYRISGSWRIQRSTKKPALHVDFQGLDDMKTLPMSEAYACVLREDSAIQLYFSRQRTWKSGLKTFVSELDNTDSDNQKE